MKITMESVALVAGIALMLAGVGLLIVSVFRAVGHFTSLGVYELALPVAGFGFIVLGRWMIQ